MGLSIRVFIVEDDDTIKRLPLARYECLLERDPDERLLEYVGKRVRYALIVVGFFSLEQQDKRVIDARHIFARKRYFDKNRWGPADEVITAIAEAIFGKLI